jgi:predicted flap endonuclease-1-like 5' DNA nuclease
MTIKIHNLKGVQPELAAALLAKGIRNSDELLAASATPALRTALAQDVGVNPDVLLELANRADLARINGIGGIYSDLLECSGVETVKELATRRPDNLHCAIVLANRRRSLAKMPPSEDMIDGWIKQARVMPRMLEN